MEKPAYRPDVDGLRAVAVLSVIFYHAGFDRLFGGGYVGVDVFFVISGYIIARMIASQLASGTWSFVDFYERRFRRILPPLFLMLLITFPAVWFLCDMEQIEPLFKMIKRTVLGLANFYLYRNAGGYFDSPENELHLLHTWSLAVEEQFYLVLPLLLWLLWKFGKRAILPCLLGLTLLSLAFSVWMAQTNPRFDFYMLPTRACELLLGVVLALGEKRWPCRAPALTHLAGLILIGLSVLLFGLVPKDAFPGAWALLPCVGTALCIWAGSGAGSAGHDRTEKLPLTVRLLGSRPMRGIGLISYGLYLYHWPVLVLLRQSRLDDAPPPQGAILLSLAGVFALSTLSCFFIEQPIRQKRVLAPRRKLFAAALGVTLIFFALGHWGRKVIIPYMPPGAAGYPLSQDYWDFVNANQRIEDGVELTPLGETPQPPSFLVLGDSHSIMLAQSLHDLAAERGRRGDLYAKYFGHYPLPTPATDETCRGLLESRSYTTCLFAFRWTYMFMHKDLVDYTGPFDLEQTRQTLTWVLDESIALLEKRGVEKIFILLPVPAQKATFPPSRAVRLIKHGKRPEDFLYTSLEENRRYNQLASDLLHEVAARHPQVRLLDPTPFFCSGKEGEERCLAIGGGRAWYQDDDHLSVWGVERMKPLLAEILSERNGEGTGEEPEDSPEKSPR